MAVGPAMARANNLPTDLIAVTSLHEDVTRGG